MFSRSSAVGRVFGLKASAVFLLALLFFGWDVGNTSLWNIDEPIYAQSLKEQIAQHNLVVPTFNARLMPDKPALNYWLMWTGVKMLGMNSWGLRMGSAVVGALLVLYLIIGLRRLYGENIALISGLMTATALHSTVIFRGATPDPLLILTVTIALLSYLRGYLFPDIRSREILIAYAAMALATLDKGPIGFLLPGLIIVLFLLLRRELSFLWREGRLTWGVPIFLIIALPWYLAVGVETHWAWDRAFVFKQNIGRFSDSMQGHRGPWVYYLISTFLGMLPWSIFLPQVFRDAWLSRQQFLRNHPKTLFLLVWAAAWIGFFTLSATKLPNYVWEAYPPLFILLAAYFEKVRAGATRPTRRGLILSAGVLFLIGLAMSLFAGLVLPLREPHLPDMVEIGLPYLLAAAGAGALFWHRRWVPAWVTLGVGGIALTALLVFVITPSLNRVKPSREMGQRIAALQGPQPYRLASWQWFQPSFLFYAGRGNTPIRHLQTLTELPAVLGPEPLYLVCPEHAVAAVRAAVPAAYRQQTVLLRYEIYNHENIALLRISPRTRSLDHAITAYYHK